MARQLLNHWQSLWHAAGSFALFEIARNGVARQSNASMSRTFAVVGTQIVFLPRGLTAYICARWHRE